MLGVVSGVMSLRECAACGMACERTFADSWSGLDVCAECLALVIGDVNLDCQTGEREDDFQDLLKSALGVDVLAVDS